MPDWQRRAACRSEDPELFFPSPGDWRTVQRAKAVCARCPVRTLCLAAALNGVTVTGIWGGTSGSERRALARVAGRKRGATKGGKPPIDVTERMTTG
jgi:WhiB family redox-sensing transcriptional regulator